MEIQDPIVYIMEIHQVKAGPDYHGLQIIVKKRIKQNLRMKNFEAKNFYFWTSAVVNRWVKQRGRLLAVESQRAVF